MSDFIVLYPGVYTDREREVKVKMQDASGNNNQILSVRAIDEKRLIEARI